MLKHRALEHDTREQNLCCCDQSSGHPTSTLFNQKNQLNLSSAAAAETTAHPLYSQQITLQLCRRLLSLLFLLLLLLLLWLLLLFLFLLRWRLRWWLLWPLLAQQHE